MAMTGGIGYEIDQLTELGVPELMRRQGVDPQLKYALALQQATKMVEAAARERDMSQPMPAPANVVGQMETSLAKRLAPGVQMQGQRSQRMQNRAAMGLPGQAAPNLVRMAQGGIVGYAEGGMPKVGAKSKGPIPQMSPEENAQMLKYLEGLKKFDYYDKNPDKVSPEGRQALEADRRAFEAQFPNSFRQKVSEMMYGPSKGMAMGGTVKGYAGGGEIKAYLASMGRDIADFTQEQITAISDMLDSQVARGQNDTLRQVGRGAMDLLRDRMPSMPENAGATSKAARQFNREAMQAVNARDIGPSLTDQLNAAQRRINAENDASMQDVMTNPDNKMGIANIVNAVSNAGGDRVSMQDVMTSPDNTAGIANLLSGAKDFVAARDPRDSTMGQVLYDAIEEDISAIPGNISDFIAESGLGDLDYDAMARAILPRATDVALESDDPSLGRYIGAFVNDLVTGPSRLVEGVTESDFVSDIREGYGGEESAPVAEQVTQKPLTEAERFRRDAPAGIVSAIDRNEGEQAALRDMFPDAPEMTAQQRVEERARIARGGGDRRAPRGAGLAGLLGRIDMGKVAKVAETLGRGAGASKGFEAAQIVQESAKARQAAQARQDRQDALRQQLNVEREKIGATKATAEAKALAALTKEQREAVGEFLQTPAIQSRMLEIQDRLGVESMYDPQVLRELQPDITAYLDAKGMTGSVGGMQGLPEGVTVKRVN